MRVTSKRTGEGFLTPYNQDVSEAVMAFCSIFFLFVCSSCHIISLNTPGCPACPSSSPKGCLVRSDLRISFPGNRKVAFVRDMSITLSV